MAQIWHRPKMTRACMMQALDCVARPAGFEPTTPWFVARYSIQLSYGREARILAEGRSRGHPQ